MKLRTSADYILSHLQESILLFGCHYLGNCFLCSYFVWAASKASLTETKRFLNGGKKKKEITLFHFKDKTQSPREFSSFWVSTACTVQWQIRKLGLLNWTDFFIFSTVFSRLWSQPLRELYIFSNTRDKYNKLKFSVLCL